MIPFLSVKFQAGVYQLNTNGLLGIFLTKIEFCFVFLLPSQYLLLPSWLSGLLGRREDGRLRAV